MKHKDAKSSVAPPPPRPLATKLKKRRRELSDDEDNNMTPVPVLRATATAEPWRLEFDRYMSTVEDVRPGMSIVRWWGVSAIC